ncbi:hypothetical protein IQ07DRAFT_632078 [Pyrenochaeta sp. DS3sAY3a]|nr:hypothetical protein IQ07DRAFT_632078 [Pyrenochaeta sp. DS3sAY3a]
MRVPIFSNPRPGARYIPSATIAPEDYTPTRHPTNVVRPQPQVTNTPAWGVLYTPPCPYRLDRQGLNLSHSERDTIELIVGSEDSPTGLCKVIVSRPYIMAFSKRWAEIIRRKKVRRFRGRGIVSHIVVLPEDDAEMMRLLMLVAHFRMELVPSRLNLDQLVRLSLVAERYGMEKLVAPQIDAWLLPYCKTFRDPGWEPWLFLMYQFGQEKNYLTLARHMALTCGLDDRGNLVSNWGRQLTKPLPLGGLEIIKRCRIKVLSRMVEIINDVLSELHSTNHCTVRFCSTEDATLCTAAKKLRLERYLSISGITAGMQNLYRTKFSPNQLYTMLKEATVKVPVVPPGFEDAAVFPRLLRKGEAEAEAERVAESKQQKFTPNRPSQAKQGKEREYEWEKPLHVRHAEIHGKCSLGPMLLARLEDLARSTNMGLAADARTMDEIRANAIRYGRIPDVSYDRNLLFKPDEGMTDWHAGVVSSGQVQSGCFGLVGSGSGDRGAELDERWDGDIVMGIRLGGMEMEH